MICGKCGKENEAGDKFCSYCGAEMETAIICRQCGKENEAGDKFCIYCGAALGEAAGVSAGENAEKTAYEKNDGNAGDVLRKRKLLIAALAAGIVLMIGIGSAAYFTGDTYHCKKAMRLAEKNYEAENYQEALHYYEEALEIDETLAEAYLKSADIYMKNEKYKEAVKRAREGVEETGDGELAEMLAKAYAGLADQYIADGKYEKALESIKEGLAETESEILSEKRSELYMIMADACAEAEDEEGELQILAEAYEVTGEDAFMERQDRIYQRQEEELRLQEEEAAALQRKQEEEQAALEQAREEEQAALENQEDMYWQEETSMAEAEEEYALDETHSMKTNIAKMAEQAENSNQYSIEDFYGKEMKIYEWDGVERKIGDNVGKTFYSYRYTNGGPEGGGGVEGFGRISPVNPESEQVVQYVLEELVYELGVAGTKHFLLQDGINEMNGYLLDGAYVVPVSVELLKEKQYRRVTYYLYIVGNTVYVFPPDVTPNE